MVRIVSFGFKYGEPSPKADMRLDLQQSGTHRSVVFAEELATRLVKDGREVEVEHLHLRVR